MKRIRPIIGVTLDSEQGGTREAPGYSIYPWYALRKNYMSSLVQAGGLPVALPHHAEIAEDMLDAIDALVVTGGAFDVDPRLYGLDEQHETVVLKQGRTRAEMVLLRGALERDMPILGICGGQQLLAVALGGTLIQHIPDSIEGALAHEQPNPRHEPGHPVRIEPGTLLARIVGTGGMQVNSAHHQAVRDPGRGRVNAVAGDGVIEGIEHPDRRFCLGLQWHPEFGIDAGDRRVLEALVSAAAG